MITLAERVRIVIFFGSHFFRIHTKFFGFWSRFYKQKAKRYFFQYFRIFSYNIFSVVCEAKTAYVIWCIPNIYKTYFLGEFSPKI